MKVGREDGASEFDETLSSVWVVFSVVSDVFSEGEVESRLNFLKLL